MIEHFVLANLGLYFAYWSSRPALSLAVLLAVDVLVAGVFEFEYGASHPAIQELLLFRPISLLFGVVIGGGFSLLLDKPSYPLDEILLRYRYHLGCLAVTLIWIGSVLTWQLAPSVWYIYLIVFAVQLLLVVLSYFVLWHDDAWKTPPESHNAFIVHFHFFVINCIFLNVPFLVGQSINSSTWPFYYSVSFFGVASLYALIINTFHRVRVASFITASIPNGGEPMVERL
jgi:hypothetical protein